MNEKSTSSGAGNISMHPSTLNVSIHRGGASVNDTRLGTSGPTSQFHALLGIPDRIVDGSDTAAPIGYRNNQCHYYDTKGVTLNEHHYTHQIQAMNFVFDTRLAVHPTQHSFRGEMTVGGLRVVTGTLERQLSHADLEFTAQLPGSWFATIPSSVEGRTITVVVSTRGPKLRSGRRSRTKWITSVCLCLPHDPWDTAHNPESRSRTNA